MKLRTDEENIIGSSGQTTKFSIASSAKAFKILSSNLYKNKIRAIVRELACNCVDAHKMINSTENFEIKVPSSLDPRFVIRDFGPGLSHDDIDNLYTTYFASTKSESNDFIGALGLGSKSPFSYTDTFTVVSYHEGMARGYTAMLDKGEPVLRPVFVEEMTADDRTGLEVTVPVKPNDLNTWLYEIKYVLRPFNEIQCTLKGTSMVIDTFPDDECFAVNRSEYETSGLYAIMGNIVYPLRDVKGLKAPWLQSKSNVVYIRFPLGELDITPSREELSLDEETVQNVLTRCAAIDARTYKEDVAHLKTITDYRKFVQEMNKFNYNARNVIRNSNIQINGLNVTQIINETQTNENLMGGTAYDLDATTIRAMKIKYGSGYTTTGQIRLETLYGVANEKPVLIIDDKNSRRLRTLRGMAKAGHKGYVTLFKESDPFEMRVLERIKSFLGEGNYTVLRIMDPEMVKMYDSIVPEKADPTEKRPTSPNVARHVYKEGDGWRVVQDCYTASEIAEFEGYGIYQKRDDFKSLDGDEAKEFLEVYEARNLAQACGITEFYAFRPAARLKALKNENIDCLMSAFEEKYVELLDDVDYDQYIGDINSTRFMTRLNDPAYGFEYILSHFVGSPGRTKEYSVLKMFSQYFRAGTECITGQCSTIFNILQRQANTTASVLLDEFKLKHACVYYTLNNSWDLSQDMIDDVKRQVKAK